MGEAHQSGRSRLPRQAAGPESQLQPLRTGTILIVRHGRPILSPRDAHPAMKAAEYRAFWTHYDASGLAPDSEPPAALRAMTAKAEKFFASALIRSQDSARAVIGPAPPLVIDPVLVEADLPPPTLWGLRLRPRHWGIVARIAWRLGRAGGMESHAAARKRAMIAARTLTEAAERGHDVALFGHGWFNRMIISALKDKGWRVVRRRGGHSYWSWRLLVSRDR